MFFVALLLLLLPLPPLLAMPMPTPMPTPMPVLVVSCCWRWWFLLVLFCVNCVQFLASTALNRLTTEKTSLVCSG